MTREEKSFRIAVGIAKAERKPLNLFPGEAEKLDINDLPSVSFDVHPGLVIVNNLYLDYHNGGFHIEDIRHLLTPGRFYAVTAAHSEWTRVTEYLSEADYKKQGNPYFSDVNTREVN